MANNLMHQAQQIKQMVDHLKQQQQHQCNHAMQQMKQQMEKEKQQVQTHTNGTEETFLSLSVAQGLADPPSFFRVLKIIVRFSHFVYINPLAPAPSMAVI